MTQISFKADNEFSIKLKLAAKSKGITPSAYMKLNLKKQIDGDLSELTENGLTIAEEQAILEAVRSDNAIGPFDNIEEAIEALKSSSL